MELLISLLIISSLSIAVAFDSKFLSSSSDYDECMKFVTTNMPQRDVGNIPTAVLNESITYALLTRNTDPFTKWTSDIPMDIFKNYVLPYATLSESRDNWRKLFYTELLPVVSSMEMDMSSRSKIVLKLIDSLNSRPLFKEKSFEFVSNQEPMRISPFEVYSYQYASCTGYSNFFTAILRSIGIPTRVAGTPQWDCACAGCDCSGPFECNHNWIEIYDENGYWSFTDAFPSGSKKMNQTWFYPKQTNCSVAGNTNHSIFASSFAPTDGTHFIMEWDYSATYVPGWDVSLNYHVD